MDILNILINYNLFLVIGGGAGGGAGCIAASPIRRSGAPCTLGHPTLDYNGS